ncbi:hypothetical protein BgiBS90_000341, partial [Biomphalaria glabrata]
FIKIKFSFVLLLNMNESTMEYNNYYGVIVFTSQSMSSSNTKCCQFDETVICKSGPLSA